MLLTNELPESVEVGGVLYPINTDFRAGIEFETAVQKQSNDYYTLLHPFFGERFPHDLKGALQAVMLFYCCGALPEKKEKPKTTKQAYSFEADSNAIYADFWRYYQINLWEDTLHWWVFRSLFEGLPEKSEFKQRVYYRTCDLKDLPKTERKRILEIRKRIEIKEDAGSSKMTLEERNASWIAHLARRREETAGGE